MAIAHVVTSAAVSGTNGGTTASCDTSGATLLIISASYYSGHGTLTISDSKGNTWTAGGSPLTERTGAGAIVQRVWFAINPIVGTGHTFTFSGSLALSSAFGQAFSGTDTSSPFDQESGASGNPSSSLSPGSITPSVDGCLLLAVGTIDASDPTSTFSTFTGNVLADATGSYFGLGTAYEIQTTATARNPAWSGASKSRIASLNVFKPAAAASAGMLPMRPRRRRTSPALLRM